MRHGWRHSSTNGRPQSAGRCSLLNLPCARVSSRARLGLHHTSTSRTGSRTGWVHSNGRGRHTCPCRLRNSGRVRHTRRVVRSSGWDRRFSATFRRRRHGTLAPACQRAPSSVLHLGSPRAHHREWDQIRRPERGHTLLHPRQHGTQRQHAQRQHGARLPLLSSRLSLLTAARRLRPRRPRSLDSASPLALLRAAFHRVSLVQTPVRQRSTRRRAQHQRRAPAPLHMALPLASLRAAFRRLTRVQTQARCQSSSRQVRQVSGTRRRWQARALLNAARSLRSRLRRLHTARCSRSRLRLRRRVRWQRCARQPLRL